MRHPSPLPDETPDVIARLQTVLAHAGLDCDCQTTIRSAIDRFSSLERQRQARRRLAMALYQKQRITAILELLRELQQITPLEPDRTVFIEMALLFEDIAAAAEEAALNLRALPQDEKPDL